MSLIETKFESRLAGDTIILDRFELEPSIKPGEMVRRHSMHVAQTADAHVRQRLIELGWTPPDHPIAKLARYGLAVLKAHRAPHGPFDIDGGDLQEMATKAGVLEERPVTEPCGEDCACAYCDALPGTCFFVPDEISNLMKD